MNQKVTRQIKRLYRYLLNITFSGLGQASKRVKACNITVPFHQNGSGLDVKELEAENTMPSQVTIFGRVMVSLQAGRVVCGNTVLIREFRIYARAAFSSKRSEANNVSKYPCRKVERSQKKGFDVLRITLNLARGNIETNVVQPAPA